MADYYKDLFEALLNLTNNSKLNWVNEPNTNLAFSCKTIDGNTKIIIDKYTAITEDKGTPCFNLSAFDDIGRLQTEIVLCDMSEESKEYELIKKLYGKVSSIIDLRLKENSMPFLNKITESLHSMMAE